MDKQKFYDILNYLKDQIAGTEFENNTYAVGGSVRDLMMGSNIKDIDLVISLDNGGIKLANFLESKGLLKNAPAVYERYGTCMFKLIAFPNDELEAVQTRKEKYTDYNSRNPETAFGSLEDDSVRRDLTINALYYDISNSRVCDFTNKGLSDMENKLLRTTTDPDAVFDDDPLRILRVVRFAARLGWNIDCETYESMKKNVGRLSIVSKERKLSELKKILSEKDIHLGVRYLLDLDVFKRVWNIFDTQGKEEMILKSIRQSASFEENMLVILMLTGVNLETAKDILKEEVYVDNETIYKFTKLWKSVEKALAYKYVNSDVELKAYAHKFLSFVGGDDELEDTIGIAIRLSASRDDFEKVKSIISFNTLCIHEIASQNWEYGKRLPLTGDDILSELKVAGKEVGNKLKDAWELVYREPTLTKEELISRLRDRY